MPYNRVPVCGVCHLPYNECECDPAEMPADELIKVKAYMKLLIRHKDYDDDEPRCRKCHLPFRECVCACASCPLAEQCADHKHHNGMRFCDE